MSENRNFRHKQTARQARKIFVSSGSALVEDFSVKFHRTKGDSVSDEDDNFGESTSCRSTHRQHSKLSSKV
jgi:hypothetical protein